jgi:hypothetical protein
MTPGLAGGYVAKARQFVHGPSDLWLLARMTVWCCTFRCLKRVVPLPVLVNLARRISPRVDGAPDRDKIVTLARWVSRFTRVSPQGDCLERGLVTYRYLIAQQQSPTLVIGVAASPSAAVRGHAWVEVAGTPVDDTAESLEGFRPIVSFAANGQRGEA